MKQKIFIGLGILGALIFALLLVARFTGMLLYYSIPTPSNAPSINPGDKVFISNLFEPAPYNFITYTSNYSDSINAYAIPDFESGATYIHRLCALPGDILEMKNGILYVNDKNFDQNLNLNNQYKITSAEFYLIEEPDINNLEASGAVQMISKDSVLVIFDSVLINKYEDRIKPLPFIVTGSMFQCFTWNGKNSTWTVDNFGPLKIPATCYFVLGDNRHNALDSRYIGFVKKENIKGVALNK